MTKRARMPYPRPLSQLISEGAAGQALLQKLTEAEIWRLWPEIAGPTVAARAYPLRIISGVLTVAVSSAPWLQELTFLKEMIREKLNRSLGKEVVREIVLRRGPLPAAPREEPDAPPPRPLTSEKLAEMEDLAAEIPDGEIRQAFVSLMTASLQNPHLPRS